MDRPILILFCLLVPFVSLTQIQDSTKTLDEIIVKAFAYDRPLKDVPAAIAKISSEDMERFSNTNFLPALNAQPGVRMEERSPGSYRISIRGSTLRSPFGIRNVKIYWNGLPLTDHGGNTYLNLLDFGSVDNLEIIKGPGSSLYGAGTGGVILLGKSQANKNKISADLVAGSYGLIRYRVGGDQSFTKFNVGVDYAHQEADGYREQSAMKRDMIIVRSHTLVGKKSTVSFNFFHTDLFYQTPGGLTKIQYDTLPTMARPGAENKKTAIYNKTFFGGMTLETELCKNWMNTISLFGNATVFENPAIMNYEKRDEHSFGLRTENHKLYNSGKLTLGAEFQTGRSLISVGSNNQGAFVDTGNDVRLPSTIFFLFAQYDRVLPKEFFISAGLSLNKILLKFDTLRVDDYINVNKRTLHSIFSPRIALLKKLNKDLSAYISYSRGYSPPTTAEVFPSTAIYDPGLKPEFGNNYEAGLKGSWRWMRSSLTLYSFRLNQTIIKLDSAGSDYFTNSGRTSQNGMEVLLQFNSGKENGLSGWVTYSFNHYEFKNYVQNANNYSGNKVTGVAPNVIAVGIDFRWRGFYSNATANYTDRIPLNDANTDYSEKYFLLGVRLGYKFGKSNQPFDFFTGIENLTDKKYSLGNDLNARLGRYFNSASGRNFYVGLKMKLSPKE